MAGILVGIRSLSGLSASNALPAREDTIPVKRKIITKVNRENHLPIAQYGLRGL